MLGHLVCELKQYSSMFGPFLSQASDMLLHHVSHTCHELPPFIRLTSLRLFARLPLVVSITSLSRVNTIYP